MSCPESSFQNCPQSLEAQCLLLKRDARMSCCPGLGLGDPGDVRLAARHEPGFWNTASLTFWGLVMAEEVPLP